MEKTKRRGLPVLVLGVALMLAGALTLWGAGDALYYVLPAPVPTQQGNELTALYESGMTQLAGITDSLKDYAIGARKQGVSLDTDGGRAVTATLYAVGAGYFDVQHETLRAGRFISETDVRRALPVVVLDEGTALTLFMGDDAVGKSVRVDGTLCEVAGVIRGGRRVGECDPQIAYMPITTVSREGMAMQTVECVAHATDEIASAILMRDTLTSWRAGGSFYSVPKLVRGAAMPLVWVILFAGTSVLLALLARLNAAAWGRVCVYAKRLQTRYARDMLPGMAASVLLCAAGYAALLAAAFALASMAGKPLLVFAEWVPEVVVELSSLISRFWALNDANAAAVRYICRAYAQVELGRGLLRWGLLAALLGLALRGWDWLCRVVRMPSFPRER